VIDVQVTVPDELVVPVAVPVIASALLPDCTLNVNLAVGVAVFEVTSNVPFSLLPVSGKHGPVFRKLKYDTLSVPSLPTVNAVVKLNTPTPTSDPTSADSQIPFAAVDEVVVLLLLQPATINSKATSPRMARFRMNCPVKTRNEDLIRYAIVSFRPLAKTDADAGLDYRCIQLPFAATGTAATPGLMFIPPRRFPSTKSYRPITSSSS
jgi:hypothetical protein